MTFNYAEFFERRQELCGGALVVRGTRVPVRTLLASLAEGATEAEVLADFPTVSPAGLRAVVAFAAASVGEDLALPSVPAVVSEFQRRAIQNGVSVEEEHRRILNEVLAPKQPRPSFKDHLLSMPDVGEDRMFDRHDPHNALPERPVRTYRAPQ